jgi:hypothetical protein
MEGERNRKNKEVGHGREVGVDKQKEGRKMEMGENVLLL